ncbi:MAG: LamG domain-containing protein [Candidatus Kapabacteria bacterium]|nr:LamG domain-containing protein [Candidatus Kapabacteria bacterium]
MTRFSALAALASIVFLSCSESSTNTTPDVDENGITTKGLVVRYKFEGNAVNAFSGGLDGVPVTGVTWVPGRNAAAGKAAHFDGVAGHIYVPNANATRLEPTQAMTISFWINGDRASGKDPWTHIIGKVDNFSDGYLIKWNHDAGTNLDAYLIQGANAGSTPNDRIRLSNSDFIGSWHHLCYVWSMSAMTFTLYVDGVQVSQKMGCIYRGSHSGNKLYIGGQPYDESGSPRLERTIPGSLDDVRIYDRALTIAEIAALAGENKP